MDKANVIQPMRILVVPLCLFMALLLPSAQGRCADAGPVALSVPEGFEGPSRSDENGGTTVGWIKHRPASDGGTLLQISAIDVGNSLDGITPAQRTEATTHYLLEFLKGIGQRLKEFEYGGIEQLSLAGLPAARARWTGNIDGKATIGVTYCVLVRHSVVSLQTEDVGSAITPGMYSAIGAIERVRVR